jgi:hypothetical protein
VNFSEPRAEHVLLAGYYPISGVPSGNALTDSTSKLGERTLFYRRGDGLAASRRTRGRCRRRREDPAEAILISCASAELLGGGVAG